MTHEGDTMLTWVLRGRGAGKRLKMETVHKPGTTFGIFRLLRFMGVLIKKEFENPIFVARNRIACSFTILSGSE